MCECVYQLVCVLFESKKAPVTCYRCSRLSVTEGSDASKVVTSEELFPDLFTDLFNMSPSFGSSLCVGGIVLPQSWEISKLEERLASYIS